MYVDLTIEGIPVQVMADTGSQSTIISHDIIAQSWQTLGTSGITIAPASGTNCMIVSYGKDRKKTKSELKIWAEALLTMEADDAQIQTLVFIQPDSDQPCFLGMNAAPSLNLQFLRANGQPLKSTQT